MQTRYRIGVVVFVFMMMVSHAQAQGPYTEGQAQDRCSAGYPAPTPYGTPAWCANDALFTQFVTREVVGSASVGRPGRERAYIILTSVDDVPQDVLIEIIVQDRPSSIVFRRRLAAKGRHVIDLLADSLTANLQFFSVVAYFGGTGSMDMAWHRALDFAEVDSKPGKPLHRQQ